VQARYLSTHGPPWLTRWLFFVDSLLVSRSLCFRAPPGLLSVLNAEQLLRFDEGPPSQDAGWRWMNGRIPAAYPSYQTPEVLWMERFWSSGVIGRFDRLE